jgi:hypothetical protein
VVLRKFGRNENVIIKEGLPKPRKRRKISIDAMDRTVLTTFLLRLYLF